MDKKVELTNEELNKVNGGTNQLNDIPDLEAIGPYASSSVPDRNLDINPTDSGIGTTLDNNTPAPDISPRNGL